MGSAEELVFESEHSDRIAEMFGRDATKPGRPTAEEREFRETFEKGIQLRLLEEHTPELVSILSGRTAERISERDNRDEQRSTKRGFESILKGIIPKGLKNIIGDEGIDFADETIQLAVSKALIVYGPIVAGIVALWLAESFVKLPTNKKDKEGNFLTDSDGNRLKEPFPQVLHNSYAISIQLLRLIDVLGNFVAGGLGGITDFVNDPIGSIVDGLGIDDIAKTFGIGLTPEETEARQEVREERNRQFSRRFNRW